ncbi:MAG: hypothetical protein B6D59_02470 [Campylobacteraceae bacterium 4484_4]|nr:MAG: hypothetical protein B6D59_02470 [Campylobacteraceae bacterium 4484_4]
MSEILLSNEVLIYLFGESILYLFAIIAFIGALHLLLRWDFSSTSEAQYRLEKRAYLITLIILFILALKILLLPYFAYTIDALSALVPGAMCAAGVIGANDYGYPLLFAKIFLIFSIGIWMIVNRLDVQAIDYPYFRSKYLLYLLLFLLMSMEYGLDLLYFSHISTKEPVQCCSVVFGASGSNVIPLGLTPTMLLAVFYLIYLLNLIFAWQKNPWLLALGGIAFFYFAFEAVVHIFGTYIYELPTHKCPFCMLQGAYYYVGYLLWALLFAGVFFSIANAPLRLLIHRELSSLYRLSRIFNTLFVILVTLYPLVYYIRNGVWL